MRRGLGRSLQVSGALVRTSLQTAMQYRSDFVLDGVTGIFRAFAAVAPIALVFGQTDQVLGWTAPELTLIMGLYFFMQAVIAGFVEPNLGEIVEAIRNGNLDLMLLKPADAQLLASIRRIAPGRLWDLLVAVGLVGWAVRLLPPPGALDVLVAVVMVGAGIAAMYGIWLLAICTSFWLVRVDNLRFLLWSATDAGRWPLDVFARWVRFGLVVVIPVGLLTTFPVVALRGEWSGALVAVAVLVSAGFVVGSRVVWKYALAGYTSASS
jgi:ABC-2 type transport system permease protein